MGARPVAKEDKLSEQFVVRLTLAEAAALDRIKDMGGFSSRNETVRSILRAVIDDDERAHGGEA